MLVRSMIDNEFNHHLQAAIMGCIEESLEVVHCAIRGMNAHIVSDVVTIIAERRRKEWQEPDAGDAKVLQIIQLLQQPRKVAYSVVVAVKEGANVQLIDDRVFEPERIRSATRPFASYRRRPARHIGSMCIRAARQNILPRL